jgi:uncharacterized protein (DUF1501 family)
MSVSLDRRSFLGTAALLAAPRVLFAQAATERRFIFIIQRGAADGLSTVVPYAVRSQSIPPTHSSWTAPSRCIHHW